MTRSDVDDRPLLLRREPFGGILFDPVDGTHVEVDSEAYDFLSAWLVSGRAPTSTEEEQLAADLTAEIPSLRRESRECRLVADNSRRVHPYANATVLGSPTLVDLQLTSRCRMGCPHCYASSRPDGDEMTYDAVRQVIEEIADAGVCQLALGGGEPLLHPHLSEILYAARDAGLVPNLTTTGDGLTPKVLRAFADCCGAVALSLEGVHEEFDRRRRSGFAFFETVHAQLRSHEISTVFQITLSVENIPSLTSIVDYCLSCPDLYGVIFLAYKPAGRGVNYQTLLSGMDSQSLFAALRDAFIKLSKHTRVGYDCCLTPGIVGMETELGHNEAHILEGCSAVRKSIGITPNLDVVPCTFLTHRSIGNLGEESFLDIWHGDRANEFRAMMDRVVDEREECRSCRWRTGCLGGCPEWDLVECNEDRP